jgi:protein-S-isoprenylcysteine O-methyltransferase Ste14
MRRVLVLAYGLVTYALFFGTFCYSIGFLADLFVPKSIDSPAADGSPVTAVLVNLAVLTVFALQHSVMARPGFKRAWTKIIPEPAERSTYVLLSTLAMWLVFWGWQPIGGTVWSVQSAVGQTALTGLLLGGFGLVLYATLLISHFDLFGVRQVWLHFRGVEYTHLPFDTPSLYKHVRHPLYVGWFVAFWATPHMSLGHLMFATVCSAYIVVALVFEERDLTAHFGARYARYKQEVPAFLPWPGRRTRPSRPQPAAN